MNIRLAGARKPVLASAIVAVVVLATGAIPASVTAQAVAAVAGGDVARGEAGPAERLFEERRYAEAKTHLAALIHSDPQNATAAYYLGRLALVDGDADEGAKWLARATALEPGRGAYHRWLGRAYARQAIRASKFRAPFVARRVKTELETAVRLDPDDIAARADLLEFYLVAPGIVGGSSAKAQKQAAEIGRRNAFRGRLASGAVAQGAKDYAAAEREYESALAQHPDSAAAYYALGVLYGQTKQYDKAFATFERLLERLPDETAANYWIGRTGAMSGANLERAEQAFKAYLAQPPREGDPSLASAHYRLGTLYERQGKRDLAREEYAATLRLDPHQSDARKALKRLH